jgi:putative tryptophan/tyrosine transport system substrate-binding protein
MRRRDVIGLAALTLACRAQAQPLARLPVVGFLGFATAAADQASVEALRQGLRDIGHVEGETILVDPRHADGDLRRAAELIADMVGRPVHVFIAPGPAAARSILKATKIPIVAIGLPPTAAEPDLFASLAKPGGSLTGFSSLGEDLSVKRIELLRELLPAATVVGILHNAADPVFRDWGVQTEISARAQGLKPLRFGLSSSSDGEAAAVLRRLRADGADAVIVIRDFLTHSLTDEIVTTSTKLGMPVLAEQASIAHAGAIMSYGTHFPDLFRRAAAYADRIIKGERPGDLPIQLPTRFELIINMRVVKALGLVMPESLLLQADEVIE